MTSHVETDAHGRPIIPSPDVLATLPSDGGEQWNRLVFEQSPYLLQHAANPVDWWPWGEAAFERARELDKPVFLSVGYSTCHWCHVMERESFEDPEIGALMNDAFINIKVDREERPDIDSVYMTVTQALTGSGGWPMTVLMTPDKKPFFAGTYFPREGRYGRPGMAELVPYISNMWKTEREKLTGSADQIVEQLGKLTGGFPGGALEEEILRKAFEEFRDRFDGVRGGFGDRPKFPTPHNLSFLLRYHARTGDAEALAMVTTTLTKMRLGGIFDHVGFGFHRYSTDGYWLLPHFEKMLYDQAMLTIAYTEAYQVTGDPLYRQTVDEIVAYVLRDMTSEEGGFYSAEDADSEGEEGKFYVWTTEEVLEILGEDLGRVYTEVYQFDEEGNFREEKTGQLTGANIPHLRRPVEEVAKQRGVTPEELQARLEEARQKLFAVREERVHPLKDDKILTDWNGLMIAALAKAGAGLGREDYLDAARRAADFVLEKLRTDEGRLLKRYRRGEAGLPAHLEDYAYFSWALLELHQATGDLRYLEEARRTVDLMIDLHYDDEAGAFFLTADDGEKLIVRAKEAYDGAQPSGNSVAAHVLARLGRLLANEEYEKRADATVRAFSGIIERGPSQFAYMLHTVDFLVGPSHELVITGPADGAFRQALQRRFVPNLVLITKPEAEGERAVALAPYLEHHHALDGQPTAYLCRNYACEQPTTDPEVLLSKLPAPPAP